MVKEEEYNEEYNEDEDYELTPEDEEEILEIVPKFDFERLVTEGSDGIFEREIEFFDKKTQTKMKMPIFVKPITRAERNSIERKISNKNAKVKANLTELLCEYGWVQNKDGIRFDPDDIKRVPDGVTNSVAEQINFVSGQFKDRFEERCRHLRKRAFWKWLDPDLEGSWFPFLVLIKEQNYQLQPKMYDLTDLQFLFLITLQEVYGAIIERNKDS